MGWAAGVALAGDGPADGTADGPADGTAARRAARRHGDATPAVVVRSNQEIAGTLHLSPTTARTCVSRLLTRLDARNRSQLVVLAYETGLVSPGTTPG